MPVYLIRAGESGPVKIGFAENVLSRLIKMQSDNHEPLTIIRQLVGGLEDEAALHSKFSLFRLRGEWFRFIPAMLGDVGLVDVVAPPPSFPPGLRGMALLRAHRGVLAHVAYGLGMTRAAVVKWDRVPGEYTVRVEEITGIARHLLRPDLHLEPPSKTQPANMPSEAA